MLRLEPTIHWTIATAKRRSRRARPRAGARHAFTLIELLLVLVILAILAGFAVQRFNGRIEQARLVRAKADLNSFDSALTIFKQDNGRYPTTQEGLQALASNPGNLPSWTGPYVKSVANDAWDKPYIFRSPGTGDKPYDLLSGGPDGQEGGSDDIVP